MKAILRTETAPNWCRAKQIIGSLEDKGLEHHAQQVGSDIIINWAELNDSHQKISEDQSLLKDLVNSVHVTGGLTVFSDGLCAPVADTDWTDLGKVVHAAHQALTNCGIETQLNIEEVEHSSKESDLPYLMREIINT